MPPKRKASTSTIQAMDAVEAQFAEGRSRLDSHDFAGAEASFRRILALMPDLAEAHGNLGVVLEKKGELGAAEQAYRRALELDPESLQFRLNLAALLTREKRFDEAAAACGDMLARHPQAPEAWSTRGILLTCLKEDAAAERCFRQALDLDPSYAKARFNLSYLLLRHGRFEEGWPALEARPWSLDLEARIPAPRWQGESLVGKSLLIGSEGGHGDMIQFCRYASLLKARGAARIGIVCHPALRRLLATHPDIDDVVALGEIVPPGWDLWTLPLSLPHRCGTRFEAIPAPIPYLQAQPEDVKGWRERLPARGLRPGLRPDLRIGLAWKGNPQFENDADRSLPGLDTLAPLARTANVHFISLQKGAGEAECAHPPPGLRLFNPSAWVDDFADAAALFTQLDLVITVDTAAAHLAGALGRPCWLLLPHHKTDWRWFTGRSDSPWYPSLRLFRQETAGAWEPLIEAVAAALQQVVPDWS